MATRVLVGGGSLSPWSDVVPEMDASDVFGIAAVVVFAVLMFWLNRWLRRSEREGNFDPEGSSPVSKPGLRLLFDYREDGWRNDGSRQPPAE